MTAARPPADDDSFDALFERITRDGASTSGRASTRFRAFADLKTLVEDVRVCRGRHARSIEEDDADASEEDAEDVFEASTPFTGPRARRGVVKSPRVERASSDARATASPETLLRFLRESERDREVLEGGAEALEERMERKDAEARDALEEAKAEAREWRERCKQLRRDVPERWLSVFESYDAEIDRLGRENFTLQERLHVALAAELSRDDAPLGVDAAEGAADGDADGDAFVSIHLRRALRAVTLERDAIAAKLADVDRRERQMNLIRRHSEGVSKRLARVERLLVAETARAADAIARAERADAATASIISDYESQLSSARALIESLALRCDVDDLRAVARAHDRAHPPRASPTSSHRARSRASER